MPNRKTNITSKGVCQSKSTKELTHRGCNAHKLPQRKLIPSKKLGTNNNEIKSCSTSGVAVKKNPVRVKKTTKSDVVVGEKCQKNNGDYCKKCGDMLEIEPRKEEEICRLVSAVNVKSVRNDNIVNLKKKTLPAIQQYYKNENFNVSTESVQGDETDNMKKNSLETIREASEFHSTSQDSIYMFLSDSDSDVTYFDPDDDDNIEKLKLFRKNNYFECHSAKSRIKTRANVTNLSDHKCVYRFYLNDRLFPVPLNTDHNNKVRCVECHLPMDIKHDSKDDKINGTIQAKVKLGNTTQDMVLLLPIKESLIIEERRKEERKVNDEYVYFGVVKLTANGNSIFNKTLPQDSLALKYQKGYKELQPNERYKYKNIEDNDVIVI